MSKGFFKKHFEWMVFAVGLLLLGMMSPYDTSASFCLFERAGFEFCPGNGLGHSIAFTFRGELAHAWEAHFMGPVAVVILLLRILKIWYKNLTTQTYLQRIK